MTFRRFTRSHAGRLTLTAIPVAAAVTLLTAGVAQGAVPVSFAVSGSQFQISASQLDGTGFSQYAGVAKDTAGVEHAVAIANIASATLHDLCQSVVAETPMRCLVLYHDDLRRLLLEDPSMAWELLKTLASRVRDG